MRGKHLALPGNGSNEDTKRPAAHSNGESSLRRVKC